MTGRSIRFVSLTRFVVRLTQKFFRLHSDGLVHPEPFLDNDLYYLSKGKMRFQSFCMLITNQPSFLAKVISVSGKVPR